MTIDHTIDEQHTSGTPIDLGPDPGRNISVGWLVPPEVFALDHARRQRLLTRAVESGVGHLAVGDHVSFINGTGFDGLVQATALLAQQARLPVTVAVYLLALRHPLTVARSISSIAEMAPGRLRLGVGVGGEDRHEIESCGVDPATRGRRTDEALSIVRSLRHGEPIDHHGEHFHLDAVTVLPAVTPPVPLLVGGRSDAAIERTARFGDGWLAIWVSPHRFDSAVRRIGDRAAELGRATWPDQHALNLWCGIADTSHDARRHLAPAMETLYATPFERFERYCPHGTAERVASAIVDYADAGCRSVNLISADPDHHATLDGIAEVARLVRRALGRPPGRPSGERSFG